MTDADVLRILDIAGRRIEREEDATRILAEVILEQGFTQADVDAIMNL